MYIIQATFPIFQYVFYAGYEKYCTFKFFLVKINGIIKRIVSGILIIFETCRYFVNCELYVIL